MGTVHLARHTLTLSVQQFAVMCTLTPSCLTQVSEFKEQLFFSLGVPETSVREFSCGHVIPEENLLALCLSRGSSGVQFDFTFRSRDTPEQVQWGRGGDVRGEREEWGK